MSTGEIDDPYEPLIELYRRELRDLYDRLQQEHRSTVRRVMEREGIREEEAEAEVDRTEGPLVHDGRVIHLIRKYWFMVDRINKERDEQGEWTTEPLTFLVETLDEDDEEELVDFLTRIAYWPIGLDENNEWS